MQNRRLGGATAVVKFRQAVLDSVKRNPEAEIGKIGGKQPILVAHVDLAENTRLFRQVLCKNARVLLDKTVCLIGDTTAPHRKPGSQPARLEAKHSEALHI